MKDPLVSVILITYNHEQYIRYAIESIISQKTNFEFDIIVGEDKSTDKTREIIKEYATKDNRIKYIFRKKNIGTSKNLVSALRHAKGKYVAFLEGDDYWIDTNKLQKQVDFLNNNKDYSGIITDIDVVDRNNRPSVSNINILRKDINNSSEYAKTLFPNKFKHIGTSMMRNFYANGKHDKDLLHTMYIDDLVQWAICSNYGKIKYLPEKTTAYRCVVSYGGNFMAMDREISSRDRINALKVVLKKVPFLARYYIYMNMCMHYRIIAKQYYKNGEYRKMLYLIAHEMSFTAKILWIPYYISL